MVYSDLGLDCRRYRIVNKGYYSANILVYGESRYSKSVVSGWAARLIPETRAECEQFIVVESLPAPISLTPLVMVSIPDGFEFPVATLIVSSGWSFSAIRLAISVKRLSPESQVKVGCEPVHAAQ